MEARLLKKSTSAAGFDGVGVTGLEAWSDPLAGVRRALVSAEAPGVGGMARRLRSVVPASSGAGDPRGDASWVINDDVERILDRACRGGAAVAVDVAVPPEPMQPASTSSSAHLVWPPALASNSGE